MLLDLAMAWLLASGPGVFADPIQFPGSQSRVASPDEQFALVWVPADVAPGRKHLLKLSAPGKPDRILLEFDRWIRVAWSPDSRRFVIVNGIGSDGSESSVYSRDAQAPVPVWSALRAQYGDSVESLVAGAHHRYVEADQWLGDHELSVRVWGYGGARPFDRRFRVKMSE